MGLIKRLREFRRRNIAIREALDSLPSATCFFTEDGAIKLCNNAMYEMYRAITGRDLQSFGELMAALNSLDETTSVTRDGNVLLFPEGHARQISIKEIQTGEGRRYTEVVLSDVTELYAKRKELEQQSEEMKKMYAELKNLSGRLLEITREQEILNMKTLLHDQMNMGITAIRQTLRQDATLEENEAAIGQFRRAIEILQEENSYPQDDFNEFLRDAKVAGVRVDISGTLPKEGKMLRFLIPIFREACVNAARHADATVLNIASEMTEDAITIRITNDGRTPEGEVVPRGGLTDLGRQIENAGGKWKIRSLPEFTLTITLPADKQEKREEVQI